MNEAPQKAISTLVAEALGRNSVRGSDRLVEDLGMESVDLVSIVAALEERFDTEIREQHLPSVRTVDDLVRLVIPDPSDRP